MFLKKLKIFGFKTFAQRTEISFDQGITAMVGPNGCGKTNILDSIRWVLGESQARRLRGLHMEDVIFSGTEERKPLSMAEVILVLDNSTGIVPMDCSEIEITRRLYRSGENECYINRQPCRLRDIQEIFRDTGIGSLSYSVLEQGKVDAILSAKPLERRLLFEEAAGIAKYKQRKHEAMNKLERVEDNLLRLGDILTEVIRQKESLETQAERAQRYITMADRLAEQRRLLYYTHYRRLEKELARVRAGLRQEEERLSRSEDGLEKQRQLIEKLQRQRKESEGSYEKTREQAFDIDKDVYRKETDIGQYRRQIEGLEARKKSFHGEIKEQEDKLKRLHGGSEGDQQLVLTFGDRRTGLIQETRKLEVELVVVTEELEQLNLGLSDEQTRRFGLLKRRYRWESGLAQCNGRLAASEEWLSDLTERLAKTDKQKQYAGRELARAGRDVKKLREEELAQKRGWESAKQEAARLRGGLERAWREHIRLARALEAVQTVTGFADELKSAGMLPAAAAEIKAKLHAELLAAVEQGLSGEKLSAQKIEIEEKTNGLERREKSSYRRLLLAGSEMSVTATKLARAEERQGGWGEREGFLGEMHESSLLIRSRLAEEIIGLKEKVKELKHKLARVDEGAPVSVKDPEAEERLRELEEKRKHLADRVKENGFNLSALRQNHRRARVDLERYRDEEKEYRKSIRLKLAEISRCTKDVSVFKSKIDALARELTAFKTGKEKLDKTLGKMRAGKTKLVDSLEVVEEKMARFDKKRLGLDEARQKFRLKEVGLEHKRDGYRGRLQDECAVTPEKLRVEGMRAVRGALAGIDQEVASMKSRLDRMGEINTSAIKELKDIRERHDFMTKERDDLLKSKDDLLKIIGEAEGEARQRFEKTFDKINGNFRKIFEEFFEGGEAELTLVEIEGQEEKGVEIMARPPKLRKSSVNLLSGGQRAMTAIALLFAIFKVKASPFCILDELDAPLDDDNIVKFLEALNHFLDRSQFIIITHNKLTMEKADVIYGVTMEEKGVSKIVSVKLREAAKV